jgi:hypothetical protein
MNGLRCAAIRSRRRALIQLSRARFKISFPRSGLNIRLPQRQRTSIAALGSKRLPRRSDTVTVTVPPPPSAAVACAAAHGMLVAFWVGGTAASVAY